MDSDGDNRSDSDRRMVPEKELRIDGRQIARAGATTIRKKEERQWPRLRIANVAENNGDPGNVSEGNDER